MNPLESWLLDYLANALWQVPLLFLATWVATQILRKPRRLDASLEHRLWVITLALQALLPACTLRPGDLLRNLEHLLRTRTAEPTAQVTVSFGPTIAGTPLHLPPALLHTLAAIYACAVLYFAARLAWGLARTSTLRNRAQAATLQGPDAALWQRISHHFAVDASLALSTEISGPMTIGIRRRVLLLPNAMHTMLAPHDLAAALAHEFAHMRRRDFAWNIVQQIVALPIAFHPALWLTRNRIVEAREIICDALAADALDALNALEAHETTGRQQYARSLLRFAAIISSPAPNLHAIGILDANNLETRIMNLTRNRLELRGARRLATISVATAIALAACTSALALRVHVPTSAGQTSLPPTPPLPLLAAAPAPPTLATPPQPPSAPLPPAARPTIRVPSAPAIPSEPATAPEPTPAPEPQTSDAPMRARISSGVMAGNILTKVSPIYPPDAKAAHISGSVVLHAIIGKDGVVEKLDLVSGPSELVGSAMDAVRQWTYKPYLLNGQPTEVETTITINYNLAGS